MLRILLTVEGSEDHCEDCGKNLDGTQVIALLNDAGNTVETVITGDNIDQRNRATFATPDEARRAAARAILDNAMGIGQHVFGQNVAEVLLDILMDKVPIQVLAVLRDED